jgi:hypothetical protein
VDLGVKGVAPTIDACVGYAASQAIVDALIGRQVAGVFGAVIAVVAAPRRIGRVAPVGHAPLVAVTEDTVVTVLAQIALEIATAFAFATALIVGTELVERDVPTDPACAADILGTFDAVITIRGIVARCRLDVAVGVPI